MASSCGTCNKELKTNQYARCCVCDKCYHPTCVKLSDFRKLSEDSKLSWMCSQCRKAKASSDQLTKTDSSPISNNTAASSPGYGLTELTTEIRLLRGDVGDLKSQLKILTELLSQCNQRLEASEAGLARAEFKILELEDKVREIPILKSTIEVLSEKVQVQSQIDLTNQVEIQGINEIANENPVHIILTAAAKIGVNVAITDIDYAARVGPRVGNDSETEKRQRPLVVKFLRRDKRNEFLRAGKSRHNICSTDLDIPGLKRNVYFNERLTKENRLLFRAAKLRVKELGFKYCWIKNGFIHIRKQEGYPSISIKSMGDLLHHCQPTNIEAKA